MFNLMRWEAGHNIIPMRQKEPDQSNGERRQGLCENPCSGRVVSCYSLPVSNTLVFQGRLGVLLTKGCRWYSLTMPRGAGLGSFSLCHNLELNNCSRVVVHMAGIGHIRMNNPGRRPGGSPCEDRQASGASHKNSTRCANTNTRRDDAAWILKREQAR